jgi:hypothetical protein
VTTTFQEPMAKSNITGTPKIFSNFEEKVKEYERRIDVLTFCLEEKVLENNNLLKKYESSQFIKHSVNRFAD